MFSLILKAAITTVFAFSVYLQCAQAENPPEGWRVSISPTLWLPPVDGLTVSDGLTTTFDASQSDRINEFHPSGELFLEFTDGKWTFVFQPQYSELDLNGNLTTPIGDLPLEIRTDSLLIEYWGGRRFGNDDTWIEALLGGRYVEIQSQAHSPIVDKSSKHDWHDAMVGFRTQLAIAGPWTVESMVTVSGFDISDNTSDHTWEGRASLNFNSQSRWIIKVGYRHWDSDYTVNGGNIDENRLAYELSGPFLSLTVRLK